MATVKSLPQRGIPSQELIAKLNEMRSHDAAWRDGRIFSLVYHAGKEVSRLLKEAYGLFMAENALSPLVFPSLRQMEVEVVAMTAALLNGTPETVGNMTSGGTESILLAVKTARDWARATKPEIKEPEMLLPITAHPAFIKAAYYFGVKPVIYPVGSDFRADVQAAREALTPRTIMLVASAPCYPYGVVDPVTELAALAQEFRLWLHVDACLGGFMLPFIRRLGYTVPPFDFSVAGVSSLSADVHKYGYAAKGASVILYRNRELRRYQFTVVTGWPGGIYASPTVPGTRPGGAIAAAWAVMHFLGEEGYLRLAAEVMETTGRIIEGIKSMPELCLLGEPVMSVFAFASHELDTYAVGEAIGTRGWHLNFLQNPPGLHMMITPVHRNIVEPFLADLKTVVEEVKAKPGQSPEGQSAFYGLLSTMPDRKAAEEFILNLLDQLYS